MSFPARPGPGYVMPVSPRYQFRAPFLSPFPDNNIRSPPNVHVLCVQKGAASSAVRVPPLELGVVEGAVDDQRLLLQGVLGNALEAARRRGDEAEVRARGVEHAAQVLGVVLDADEPRVVLELEDLHAA